MGVCLCGSVMFVRSGVVGAGSGAGVVVVGTDVVVDGEEGVVVSSSSLSSLSHFIYCSSLHNPGVSAVSLPARLLWCRGIVFAVSRRSTDICTCSCLKASSRYRYIHCRVHSILRGG